MRERLSQNLEDGLLCKCGDFFWPLGGCGRELDVGAAWVDATCFLLNSDAPIPPVKTYHGRKKTEANGEKRCLLSQLKSQELKKNLFVHK